MKALGGPGFALEPLVAAHAEAMFELLCEPLLYRWLDDGLPSSVEDLRRGYAKLESRRSPDGSERWLNWVIREHGANAVAGFVQATVLSDHSAWVAYVVGRPFWGRGLGAVATGAMIEHLIGDLGVTRLQASVDRANAPSIAVLARLGFRVATALERASFELLAQDELYVRDIASRAPLG